MAMKAYRDYAKAKKGITSPELVAPVTAHSAFDKVKDFNYNNTFYTYFIKPTFPPLFVVFVYVFTIYKKGMLLLRNQARARRTRTRLQG